MQGQPGLRQRRDAAVCLANFESDGRGSSGLTECASAA